MVVLSFHLDQCHFASQQLQRGEHLQTLDDRHVGVVGAMQQEQRRVNLVGIEQRRLVDVQLTMAPRIAVGHRHLTVVVAPVALTPVAGVIGYAGMAHGSSKDVGLRLQVLRHETAIRGAHAPHLRSIDERMLLTNLLGTLDDVVGRSAPGCVHVARGPLLSEACGTAGLQDVGHIAQRVPVLRSVGRLEIAADRRASTIVIDNHGVFLRGIEVLGQIETAIDGVAPRVGEVPVAARTQFGFAQGGLPVKEVLLLLALHIHDIGRGRSQCLVGEIGNGG